MRDSLEVISLRARRAVLLVFDCRIPYIYKKNAAETPSRNFYRKVTTVNKQTQGKNIKS